MTYPLGHIASPDGERERIARRPLVGDTGLVGISMAGLGGVQDLREWSGPVTTQVGNSCCWDASLGQIESRARKLGVVIPKLSVKCAWVWAQLRDQQRRGVPYEQRRAWDQGSSIDMGTLALREHGLVSEARCFFEAGDLDPKPDGRADLQIPIDVDMAAADALLTGDYGVDPEDAPEALRMAMRDFHFPILAISVDRRFLDLVGHDVEYDGVQNDQDIIGGHAMRVVGSRPGFLLLQNSWSEAWGDAGFVWLSDRAARRGRDACVFTAVPHLT